MKGWIKLHRKIRSNPIFNDHQLLRLWLICLTEATHKERDQIVGKQTVHLMPGEFVTGRFDIRDMYNDGLKPKDKVAGEKTVFRWLETLEKSGFLTIKKTNKFSVVSIDNWGFYQDQDQHEDDGMTTKRPSKDHQMTTNKNVKNDKNEKKKDYTSQIKNLLSSYPSDIQSLITVYWNEIKHTRKSGEISKSVIFKTMEKWEKYEQVVIKFALKEHLDRYGSDSDKDEKYTLGIMRRTTPEEAQDRLDRKENQTKGDSRFGSQKPRAGVQSPAGTQSGAKVGRIRPFKRKTV